jgi:hypothetical protein
MVESNPVSAAHPPSESSATTRRPRSKAVGSFEDMSIKSRAACMNSAYKKNVQKAQLNSIFDRALNDPTDLINDIKNLRVSPAPETTAAPAQPKSAPSKS